MEQNDDATESSEEISPGENYKRELGELNYTIGCRTDCGFWNLILMEKFFGAYTTKELFIKHFQLAFLF